jgi:hypothetical protein
MSGGEYRTHSPLHLYKSKQKMDHRLPGKQKTEILRKSKVGSQNPQILLNLMLTISEKLNWSS